MSHPGMPWLRNDACKLLAYMVSAHIRHGRWHTLVDEVERLYRMN